MLSAAGTFFYPQQFQVFEKLVDFFRFVRKISHLLLNFCFSKRKHFAESEPVAN